MYENSFSAVFIVGESALSGLDHLIILAQNKQTKQLVHVGAHQAEYQCWLSGNINFSSFIERAVSEIGKIEPNGKLAFKFLPPGLSRHLRQTPTLLACHFTLQRAQKPLIRFAQDSPPWQSMGKKSNKSKLARLRKMGDISLELLSFDSRDKEEQAIKLLKQVAIAYDLRQGAINDSLPFIEDDRKFDFHL